MVPQVVGKAVPGGTTAPLPRYRGNMTATIPEQRVLPPVGAGRRRGPRVELFATNLHTPTHMEWSQDGRLLVSETTAGRVTDITSGGDFIESAPFAWGLRGPASICPLPDGRILVAEIRGNRITDVSLGGDCMGRVPVADELNHPYSLGQMGSRVFVVERGGLSHTQVRDVTPDCNTTGEVYVSRIPAVPMLGLEGLRPMGTDQRDLAMGCDSWKLVAMIDGHERMIVSSSALGQLLVVPDGGGDYLDLVDRGCLLAYGLPWKGGFTQNPCRWANLRYATDAGRSSRRRPSRAGRLPLCAPCGDWPEPANMCSV